MGCGRAFQPVQQVNAGRIVRRKQRCCQPADDKRCKQQPAHHGKGLTANAGAEEIKKFHRLDKEYSDTFDKPGFNDDMTYLQRLFSVLAVLVWMGASQLPAQRGMAGAEAGAAEQLLAMANQSRAQAGAPPLVWDAALAAAARKHCQRMVAEGQIAHRYGGEPDVSERASLAGAHFGLIEENIAVGSYPAQIHDGWMNSPGHRRNLLNPEVDRVGIALIASRGNLYAVADYSKGVAVLTRSQIEGKVERSST